MRDSLRKMRRVAMVILESVIFVQNLPKSAISELVAIG